MPERFPRYDVSGLLAEIEAAFGEVRLGDGISLHQARALDNYEGDEGVFAARTFDEEERWQLIPDAKVERFDDTLPFMDAAGMRFHLPRFLVWTLTHLGRCSSSNAGNAAIFTCGRDCDERFRLLTREQCVVVVRFLRFAAAHPDELPASDAATALRGFWGHFG